MYALTAKNNTKFLPECPVVESYQKKQFAFRMCFLTMCIVVFKLVLAGK